MNEEIIDVTTIRDSHIIASEINILTGQAQGMALYFISEIGKRLNEAKSLLQHGDWGEWLENEVSYSQSTAENYMRIAEEYANEQVSFFGSSKSQALENLEYTKLVALLAVPRLERVEFAQRVDAENLSTRELQEKIKELQVQKEIGEKDAIQLKNQLEEQKRQNTLKIELMQLEKAKAVDEALKTTETVNELQDKITALETAKSEIPENVLAQIRVEAEKAAMEELKKKLDTAKDKQKKAEQKANDAEQKLENEKKAMQEKLDHDLEQSEIAVQHAKDAINEAEKRAEALQKKLLIAGDQYSVKFRLLFSAVQNNFNDLMDCLHKIAEPTVKEKLQSALSAAIENMKEQLQ